MNAETQACNSVLGQPYTKPSMGSAQLWPRSFILLTLRTLLFFLLEGKNFFPCS